MALDKNAVIKEAQKFAGKGQYDKAIAEWKKLVKESPNDANLHNTIGDLCLKKNSKAEAVDAYKRAADILASDGFTSKAIALYKKVLNIDPNKVEVHLALGDMNAEKGLTGNALESYKIVADHFTKQKKKAEALGIYQKMADLNPSNVAFRVKLAEMYVKEGMKKEAIKAYLDASNANIGKNAFQDARQMFEKVLALDPANKEVYHRAGLVYYKEGKFNEACKALKPAFENDPRNEEVTDLYLDAIDKAGRTGDAEEVYRKLLAQDAARPDLRERLYRLYLAKKDFSKAQGEVVAIAEARAEEMDFAGAAEILKEFIAVTDDPVAGASALSDLFTKRGRTTDGAKELVSVADMLLDRGGMDDAREVLARALVVAPDLAEAKQRLNTLPAPPGSVQSPAPPGPEPVVEEFTEAPEHAAPAPPSAVETPRPAPAAPPAPGPSYAEVEDDPVLAEALTEVDVLMKYGLGAKAVEQLEGLVRKYPEHPKIRARLLDLYREQKKTDKAVVQALILAELYEKKGFQGESQSVLQAALQLAPGNVQIMAKLGIAPVEAEAVEEPEAIEEISEEITLDAGLPPGAGEEQQPLTPPTGEIVFHAPDAGESVLGFELPAEAAPALEPEAPVEEEPRYEEPAPAEEPDETLPMTPAASEAMEYEPPEPEQEERPKEPLAKIDVSEIWAEAEFYYQQGLFDEARKHYERILEAKPADPRAMERIVEITREKEEVQEFSKLAEAVEGLESLVASEADSHEDAMTSSDVDAVKSLMQEIAQMRVSKKPAPRPPKKEAVPPPVPAAAEAFPQAPEQPVVSRTEEDFGDIGVDFGPAPEQQAAPAPAGEKSEDFFDLAAELRDELSAVAVPQASKEGTDQSLDEIFEEFKKGVEAHEKKEDLDTHYNLGVAYKEMGLLDDAISEFSMTPEGESRFIQSRYMLGLCYLEKGDYDIAITEIQNALGYSYSFGEASEERIGMHYDLGLAYQGVGNSEGALQEFQKVHNLDPGYREVATKVKELQQGEFISLDEIKEDIEKEISFKFLEEGARIEREEKTKKSEKVKN